jgi:hypothetical protein
LKSKKSVPFTKPMLVDRSLLISPNCQRLIPLEGKKRASLARDHDGDQHIMSGNSPKGEARRAHDAPNPSHLCASKQVPGVMGILWMMRGTKTVVRLVVPMDPPSSAR